MVGSSVLPDRAARLLADSGLASVHRPVDMAVVHSLLRRHYQLTGTLRPVPTEKDDTFTLRTGAAGYLVKIAPPEEARAVVSVQTAAMRFLESATPELPVQRVHLTADGRDHLVLPEDGGPRVLRVLGFVDGTVWAEAQPERHQLVQVGEMLGRIDVALEAFAHPADRRELVWDLRHFHELAEMVEQTADPDHRELAGAVARLFHETVVPRLDDLETQVIHGDYSPYNVVVDEHADDYVASVIDFGDVMRSAVIFDPAVALANLVGRAPGNPWREASDFLAGYERVRQIDDRELPLLPAAALARLTLRALITSWRAHRVPARRDYLLSHAKDDWARVGRALSVPVTDVVSQLRSARRPGRRTGRGG